MGRREGKGKSTQPKARGRWVEAALVRPDMPAREEGDEDGRRWPGGPSKTGIREVEKVGPVLGKLRIKRKVRG